MHGNEDLEGFLYNRRAVLIAGSIDDDLGNRIRAQVLTLALAEDAPVRVLIDSNGGELDAGLLMFDLIRALPVPTIGIVLGKCLSMAVPLLQACDERVALPNATFLVHSARTCGGGLRTQRDIERIAQSRAESDRRLIKIMCARTGMRPERLREMLRAGDREQTEFSAERALRLKFIDRIAVKLFPDLPPTDPPA